MYVDPIQRCLGSEDAKCVSVKMSMFHPRTGSLVTLSNGNRTAQRKHPVQEFNNGVILSAEPLRENQIFEVKIDRKVNCQASKYCTE